MKKKHTHYGMFIYLWVCREIFQQGFAFTYSIITGSMVLIL
ncbi:MAG: hypothetical protein H6Q22_1394, partial [Bacteroidetes bacterium]|nr:hypothetical protein [Bacteroidota bacterium]